MTALTELRTQRAEAELMFQEAMAMLRQQQRVDGRLHAAALGYHREVCAAHAAELSLISSGKIAPCETPIVN